MAASPGGKEVGRVSVRVVPDTSRFRSQLERDLKRDLRGFKVKVRVVPDTTGFRAALKAATKDVTVKAKVKVDDRHLKDVTKTKTTTIKADVKVDDRQVQNVVKAGRHRRVEIPAVVKVDDSQLHNVTRRRTVPIDVRVNEKHAIRQVRNVVRSIDKEVQNIRPRDFVKMGPYKLKLKDIIEMDDKFRDELAEHMGKSRFEVDVDLADARAKLEKFERERHRIDVDVDANTAAVTQKIDAIARDHTSHVKVEADTAAAAAKIDALTRDRKTNLKVDVDKSKLGMITRVMDKLKDIANPSTGLMGKMGGGGDISQLLLILAVILLIAPAIAIIATLLAGIPALIAGLGAAFGVMYLGFDGIKNALKSIDPQLKKMKAEVSKVTEQAFKPLFQDVANLGVKLLPQMKAVAAGMATMFSGVTDALSSSGGGIMLEEIMGNLNELFVRMQPVMKTFTTAFLNLAMLGSQSFGTLAQTFGDFAAKFDGWVTKLGEDDVLSGAFKGLSQAFDGLGTLFFNLMDIGVRSMEQLGPYVKTFFEDIGTLLSALAPYFSTIFKWFGTLVNGFVKMLAPMLTKLAPVFDKLMMAGAKLGSALMQSLGTALTPIVESLANGLLVVLKALEPILPVITQSFQDMGVAIGAAFAKNAPQIAEAFKQLGIALAALAPKLAELIPQLMQIGIEAFPKIVEALPGLIAAFVNLANSGAIEAFTNALITLAPYIPTIVSGLTQLAIVLANVGSFLIGVVAGFANAGAAVAGFLIKIEGKMFGLPARLAKIPGQIIQGFVNAFTNGGGLISNVLEGIWNGIVATAKGILGIASPSTVFNQIGVDLIQGLINGIKSMIGAVMGLISDLASKVISAFKSAKNLAINSPSKKMIPIGESVSEGLAKGMENNQYPENAANRKARALKNAWAKNLKGFESVDMSKVEIFEKSFDQRFKEQSKKALDEFVKAIKDKVGNAWADSMLTDLGFSKSGALGALADQVFDPKVTLQDAKDVYVVKDVDEAERRAEAKKRKQALKNQNRKKAS